MLAAVQHIDHFDHIRTDPVHQNVIGVDHRLSSAGQAAGAVHVRILTHSLATSLDSTAEIIGGKCIVPTDVGNDRAQIIARSWQPNEVQDAFRILSAMI